MNRDILILAFSILTFNIMAQEKIVQTAGRDQLADLDPNLRNLTMIFFLVKCGAVLINLLFVTAVW